MKLAISYDRENSSEMYPKYFVYEESTNAVVYKGNYTQCLVVVGGMQLGYSFDEIVNKSEGYVSWN